jgi:two-component system, chemotaxis family, chemotaxis protein CheY
MKKIMIVDDSETVRTELKEVLVASNYEVIEAADGAQGLDLAQRTPGIDLIVSDLNMPEMDGIMMCSKIRQIPEYAQTPIFMLTTESSPELKAAAKSAGILAWIVKPFTAERVLGMLEKAFSMAKKAG